MAGQRYPVHQRSFRGGIWDAAYHGRYGTDKYREALADALNCIIKPNRSIEDRCGWEFITELQRFHADADAGTLLYPPGLLPFVFNDSQSYLIVVGNQWNSIIRNDGAGSIGEVALASVSITAATQASQCAITLSSDPGLQFFNRVAISGVSGMTELNGNEYLLLPFGDGVVSNLYINDAFEHTDGTIKLYYSLGHGLTTGNRIAIVTQGAALDDPPNTLVSCAGDLQYSLWTVTVLDANNFTLDGSSAASIGTTGGVANISVFTVTAKKFYLRDENDGTAIDSTGYGAYVSGGSLSAVAQFFAPYYGPDVPAIDHAQSADVLTATHFDHRVYNFTRIDHDDWDVSPVRFEPEIAAPTNVTCAPGGTSGSTTYNYKVLGVSITKGEEGLATETSTATGNATLDKTNFNQLTWDEDTDVDVWYVYRLEGGYYLRVGKVEAEQASGGTLTWNDLGDSGEQGVSGVLDPAYTPPRDRETFTGDGNYPATVSYAKGRLALAGTLLDPLATHLSNAARFFNFEYHNPLIDSDSIRIDLASRRVNAIRYLVELDELWALTAGSEIVIRAGETRAFTPGTAYPVPISDNGVAQVRPIVISSAMLYVEQGAAGVRDLLPVSTTAGTSYQARSLTAYIESLLEGATIVDWAYAEKPNRVVWCVLSDGTGLSLTYFPQDEAWGWSRISTTGDLKRIASIPEDGEDVFYAVIERTLNSRTRYHLERLRERDHFDDIRQGFYLDAAVSDAKPVAVTINDITNVSDVIRVDVGSGHGLVFGTIIELEDVEVAADSGAAPNGLWSVAAADTTTIDLGPVPYAGSPSSWATEGIGTITAGTGSIRNTFSGATGLDHLEGETVTALVSGVEYTGLTVSGGAVTFGTNVHGAFYVVGLPYTREFKTLPQEPPGDQADVHNITIRCTRSYGFKASQGGSTPVGPVRSWARRGIALVTEDVDFVLPDDRSRRGQVLVRQESPYPMTISSITWDVESA